MPGFRDEGYGLWTEQSRRQVIQRRTQPLRKRIPVRREEMTGTFPSSRTTASVPPRVKPILFQSGGISLHSFGVLVALGFLFGLWIASQNARRLGLSGDVVYDLAPWLVIGGLVGARLWYVISYWSRDFAGHPFTEIFAIWRGGLVFYGGLIVATLAGLWRLHQLKLPVWTLADCLAPGIVVGHAFGRMGCLLNGCCFGRSTSLPWAIHFPADHVTHGAAVHPTQVYEAGLNLLFLALLMGILRRRSFPGQVFSVYLMGYAILRSTVEAFRGDYESLIPGSSAFLTPGQRTSVLILAAGVILYFWLQSKATRSSPIRA